MDNYDNMTKEELILLLREKDALINFQNAVIADRNEAEKEFNVFTGVTTDSKIKDFSWMLWI